MNFTLYMLFDVEAYTNAATTNNNVPVHYLHFKIFYTAPKHQQHLAIYILNWSAKCLRFFNTEIST